jgi:hypothetical protein
MTYPEVVLSYGLGADSTALVMRWLFQPETRPCPLDRLLLVTAMTGDEWPATAAMVTRHVLPLLREHGVRYAQVARGGPQEADGIRVLDDSRAPARLHMRGPWTLSDELRAGGTIPQRAGRRKCSLKFKGWVIDTFLRDETSGPYRHVIGFEAGELGRAARDTAHNTGVRTGVYPLVEWGWYRQACESYISAQAGVAWPKSACTFCPYALATAAGVGRVLDCYASDPAAGATALVMEHLAVTLNPRQTLGRGERLLSLLAADPRQRPALDLFAEQLDSMPWRVYEVRRAFRGPGSAARSLRTLAEGTRAAATAELRRAADTAAGAELAAHDGIERVWLRRRTPGYPAAEWCLAAAPAGAADKDGPGFAAAWERAISAGAPRGLW